MRDSLRERIYRYISNRPGKYINGGEVERLALSVGYKASNASRRLRELAEEGLIERDEKKNPNTGTRSVWYRAGQPRLFI